MSREATGGSEWPPVVPESEVRNWRGNPPYRYWHWLWASRRFGLFAPYVGWLRYKAMLNDLERYRRESYDPLIGPYWEKRLGL